MYIFKIENKNYIPKCERSILEKLRNKSKLKIFVILWNICSNENKDKLVNNKFIEKPLSKYYILWNSVHSTLKNL